MHNPFAGRHVAVLGDAMVDRFVYGAVDRISPEAPIPVVRVTKRTTHLGGAGNVAANLVSLGVQPLLVSRLGTDDFGEAFFHISERAGISTDFLVSSGLTRTTSKTRVIARNQQVVRFDEEETAPLRDKERADVYDALQRVREMASVLVVSDYGKGVVDAETLDYVKRLWADGTVLVDPKPRKAISYAGVHGMTPNLAEAKGLLDLEGDVSTDDEAAAVARALVERFALSHVLLTRSADGMTLATRDGDVVHMPTHAREVADVSGAGDTVMSVFAAALEAQLDLQTAARLANAAGGVVVGKLGTASVTWDEIQEFMKE